MPRILVSYSSRFGSTAEIAAAIARELSAADFDVDVADAGPQIDVSKYDAAVIGSPSYGRKWLQPAAIFVAGNEAKLAGMPVAVFTAGALGVKSPKSAMREHDEILAMLKDIAPSVEPISAGLFHGSFSRKNLPFCLRIVDMLAGTPQGDHRDWDAIREWSRRVAARFQQRFDGVANSGDEKSDTEDAS